jgi:hypothetical protein
MEAHALGKFRRNLLQGLPFTDMFEDSTNLSGFDFFVHFFEFCDDIC